MSFAFKTPLYHPFIVAKISNRFLQIPHPLLYILSTKATKEEKLPVEQQTV